MQPLLLFLAEANVLPEGISSDYEIPDPNNETAWSPFQKTKVYDIPDQIFDQWNRGAVSTSMGLFAELNHAWVAIDNALYLWDYTNPNPEIIGYEEQHNNITAVRLVRPRAGVFVKTITHVLVVATTLEIILLGLESATAVSGVMKISLFSTRMSIGTKGINVKFIEGSADSGRIFFAADNGHEIYEITYQQEDKWFSSRCAKISHTADSLGYLVNMPAWFSSKSKDNIVDMVVDYSRKLLYTLSSESTIRVYYMDSPTTLQPVIEKKRHECLRDISHMTSASPLLGGSMKITSISPISAQEGSKLNLMATTSTGCRLYFSATRGYGYLSTQGAPSSMQIQHIKFPPRAIDPASSGSQAVTTTTGTDQTVDVDSQSLAYSRACHRFPPGFFLDLVSKRDRPSEDLLFLSAPDSARILAQAQGLTHQPYPRYYEVGCWIGLGGIVEAVGLVTPPFAASRQPIGFGNELAVQYDEPATEIAILTNTGVHIIKRRRLVDIFASALRTGGNDEGFDTEIKKFIRQYGRGETNATALAVACGQGNDASLTSSPDLRVARINDPQTLELARKCFVEHGGRPTVNDSAGAETMAQAVDSVRPSSRHEGLALYMGRLVRSLWKTPVITQKAATPGSSFTLSTTIPITKLQSVQDDLMKLKAFLDQNKSFIEGLSGPEGLHRANNPAEDIALQGEHQALYSLQRLNLSIIEGISFVQMLFDERVDEIWTTLDGSTKQRFCDLTYELLFSTDQGKDLAKVLVKAIVNRNIANGSNVDTVAEALRRRCGSFCSADDVIIFKAQELLKKASEVGPNTDLGRNHLNESLRLFQQVAGALSFDNLQTAAENFTGLNFYAGAIALVLNVANQHDRGNQAGAWEAEQKPMNDPREALYAFRKQCYDLVHEILLVVDEETAQQPEYVDGKMTKSAQKRLEAYDEVNSSEDELFLFDLYDWYLEKKWVDKLISIKSKHVVAFLTRESRKNSGAADLLWRYWVHHQEFYNAAVIQHELAQQTEFDLPLSRRIELLSRAKANANTQSGSLGRQQRQVLLHSVSELLEVANIQDEILHRLKGDLRIPEERKQLAVAQLNNQILPVNVVSTHFVPASCRPANDSSFTTSMQTRPNITTSAY